MERCGSLQIAEPEQLCGAWKKTFPQYSALSLEVGCGKGRFTCETAKEHPDTLLLAVERVPEAMVVAMERAAEQGLENVRFLDRDAARLSELFAPGEVDRLYINFCDPWPGNRHAKRRLTSGGFLKLYWGILAQNGEIQFKTDNAPLFEYSLEQFQACGFTLSGITRNLHGNGPVGVMTDYECKFYEQGIPICSCVAKKNNG